MSFTATVIKVFISSPGDVKEIRTAAEDVCHELMGLQTEQSRMLFEPVLWETDAVPDFSPGSDPQDKLNRQLVEPSDILVAIFWSRLGAPTADAPSGTVSEINRFLKLGRPVLVYRWTKPLDMDSPDADQLGQLLQYLKSIEKQCLWVKFKDVDFFKQNLRVALLGLLPQFRRVLLSAPRTLLQGYMDNFLKPMYEHVNNSAEVTLRLEDEDEDQKPEVKFSKVRIAVLLPASIRLASQDNVTQVRRNHFVRATIVTLRRPFGVVLRRADLGRPEITVYDIPTPLGALYDIIRKDFEANRDRAVKVDFDALGQRELDEFILELKTFIAGSGGMSGVVSLTTFEEMGIA
jgi:hypothetical protein